VQQIHKPKFQIGKVMLGDETFEHSPSYSSPVFCVIALFLTESADKTAHREQGILLVDFIAYFYYLARGCFNIQGQR